MSNCASSQLTPQSELLQVLNLPLEGNDLDVPLIPPPSIISQAWLKSSFHQGLGLAVYHSNDEPKLISAFLLPVGVKSFGATMLLALGLSKCIISALQYHTFNPCLSSLLLNQLYLSSLRKIKSILVTNLAQNTSCTAFSKYICSSFKMVISQQFTSSPDSGY